MTIRYTTGLTIKEQLRAWLSGNAEEVELVQWLGNGTAEDHADGYDEGLEVGRKEGYGDGYRDGYDDGKEAR